MSELEINIYEQVPLILSVHRKDTGEELPQAILTGVVWHQDNPIGNIAPNPDNPNLATFTPSKAGVTHISASATITIP